MAQDTTFPFERCVTAVTQSLCPKALLCLQQIKWNQIKRAEVKLKKKKEWVCGQHSIIRISI